VNKTPFQTQRVARSPLRTLSSLAELKPYAAKARELWREMNAEVVGQRNFKQEMYSLVARTLRSTPRVRRVLDVGCGYGHLVRTLARAGFEVVGLEQDPFHIAIAVLLANGDPSQTFLAGSWQQHKSHTNAFDGIIASLLFHELLEKDRIAVRYGTTCDGAFPRMALLFL
jgi:2-polyprenyl-3-methyl-5-hydroxy-6-metoxy-1,4-benzoquinol methylase